MEAHAELLRDLLRGEAASAQRSDFANTRLVDRRARVRRANVPAALGGGQLMVSGYASVDFGLRQSFKLGKVPASFRFTAYNVFDAASWKVVAPNTIYIDERRRYNLSITADF